MNETPEKTYGAQLPLLVATFAAVFFVLVILGRFPSLELVKNNRCFTLLGCNEGVFGYDGFEHIVCGIGLSFAFLWIKNRYTLLCTATKRQTCIFFFLFAWIGLVGIVWEIIEFSYDMLRLHVFAINNPFDFAQPTKSDTAGDMLLNFTGFLIAWIAMRPLGFLTER